MEEKESDMNIVIKKQQLHLYVHVLLIIIKIINIIF